MTKTRKEMIIIGLMLLLVIALIGVSWAVFNYSALGTKVNTITTGSITMSYEESDNTISLNGALPTTDKTGMVRLNPGEYFDFTVSSTITGDVNINYEISAKEVGVGTIDGSNIKLYLTRLTSDGTEEQVMSPRVYTEESTSNNFTGRPANEMSLYTSSMSSSESNKYRLRMYVDEGYNPQGDGGNLTFSVKINVYGRDRVAEEVSTVLLNNIPEENQYDDEVDTFITGEDPNNYIWYSGKLWRAVSVNNDAKTTKLVTQWNISTINYNASGNPAFEGSYMEDWLNDTSVDGFLGNLRDYENFIVTDAKWNATLDATALGSITRPNGKTTVTAPVGLLNMYEYQTSYIGTTYGNGYLNNGLYWWTLTPQSTSLVRCVNNNGTSNGYPADAYGVRPSINLKSSVRIADGDGTIDNPYRLNGDNDTNLSGTLLSSRYSGEYIRFGNDENNLYRIVSHETSGLTKITSAEPLKNSGTFITSAFGSSNSEVNYSTNSVIGTFLNGEYLTNYVGNAYSDMIEDSTTWYLGTVGRSDSYKLAKYTDTNMSSTTSSTIDAKVGLLRFGELMAGQFDRDENNISYWTLTQYNASAVRYVGSKGNASIFYPTIAYCVRPSINLKSNVQIINGDGTKNNPFELS